MTEHQPSPQELAGLIAAEREAIHRMVDERLVPLLVRRRALVEAARGEPAPVSRPARPGMGPARRKAPTAPSVSPSMRELALEFRVNQKSPCSRIVMASLEEGPEEGLPGRVLNATLLEWGHSLDTAEATKTRLGHLGAVDFDPATGVWALTDAYRKAMPTDSWIVLTDRDRGRASNAAEQTGGRIILDALAAGPPEGITRPVLVQAVIAAGYSRSLGRHAFAALDIAGMITKGESGGKWRMSLFGHRARS